MTKKLKGLVNLNKVRVAPYVTSQNANWLTRVSTKYNVTKSDIFNSLLNDARKTTMAKWADVSRTK